MQIPITSGIYTDGNSDYRVAYPVNYVFVPISNGVSDSFLRPAYGIKTFISIPGEDRGGINWDGVQYRVIGESLYRIQENGFYTELGEIPGSGKVKIDYGFDRMSIAANDGLYYYKASEGVTQNTDPDLGTVLDQQWIDGYYMTTDGTFIVITELNDPFAVNPLKYGTTDIDPDPVIALLRLRGEIIALNRYTCQTLRNVGGNGFPFEANSGAIINKGPVARDACTVFSDVLAFVGSGKGESLGVYLALNGSTTKVSSQEIDLIINSKTAAEISRITMDVMVDASHQFLFIHLDDQTLLYDHGASQQAGGLVWSVLTSSFDGLGEYRGRNLVFLNGKWYCGDSHGGKIGTLTRDVMSHFGDTVRWEFTTPIIYNQSSGAIFHELELVALTGRCEPNTSPKINTQYSVDGVTWSQLKTISAGKQGDRAKRLAWFSMGKMETVRIQRFSGWSDSLLSFSRLEARLEPLSW